ncbi:TPA: LPXTG cell wall anchor domain-containing protein [Streptococcus suis]|nr:LPXTG cell wall anchor domain-containing protein [Streptococcus suis]HEM5149371.1 LPXTG cell wall anchor domain-containing protein [Streptococcus suis]HEM5251856.1 LPXTG cell wall anchor domain-containing protein [Streptococcus suis]
MKIKRSSSKKQLHKWTKLGVGLAAVTVLGGLVEPGDVPLLSNCTVEAQELTNQSGGEQALPADTATVTIELENTGVVELVGGSYRYQRIRGFERLEIHLQPGETYTLPTYDGYKLINFKNLNEVTDIAPEDAVLSYADFTPGQRVRLGYDYLLTNQVYDAVTKQYVDRETVIPSTTPSINSPTDTPPAQPTENPVDQSITIKAVYTEEQIEPGQKVDVLKEIEYTLKPGESVVLEPLTFEGWTSRVVQESQTVTYEEAKARPNKEYYFYYIEEGTTPTDKQVEQPVETPTEQPVEKPVKRPTASPTAKPTEQSASEKQATKQGDKEPAAPASQSKQSTAKPTPTSQSQAKSLPATGEVSSVLHLTGLGLLGLAGLVVKRRQRKSL